MRINQKSLTGLIKNHEEWIKSKGKKGEMASLIDADLSGECLTEADLRNANLKGANLWGAKLNKVNLNGANLSGANLSNADLSESLFIKADLSHTHSPESNFSHANLHDARLTNAFLNSANFYSAYLSGAKFRSANLMEAKFIRANLDKTDFSKGILLYTMFSTVSMNNTKFERSLFGNTYITDCDLSKALELEKIKHLAPSSIGVDVILASKGKLPISFLKGCGLQQKFIETMLALAKDPAFQFYSCFISYSSKDEFFTKKLKNDLEINNVKCWFFSDDAKWGEDVFKNIDSAIKQHDKLIIVCSENSLNSEPVLREIERGLLREKELREKHVETKRILFPIKIDDYIEKWDNYLKSDLIRITIGDFCSWKIPSEYKKAFDKLLEGLEKDD